MSAIVTFDDKKCQKDGICGLVCPTRRIMAVAGESPLEQESKPCLQCGQCIAFCPHGAIAIKGLDSRQIKKVTRDCQPTGEAVDILLQSRRSIRQYKDDPVDKQLLRTILSTASFAPSGKNARNLRYVVVYEKTAMRDLGDCIAACLLENAKGSSAPAIPEGAALARAWYAGNDLLFRGAPHLICCVAPADWYWKNTDSAITLTYIEISAASYGLGTCWGGYVTVAGLSFKPVRDMLGIDSNEILGGAQMIGHPRLRQKSIPPRSPYPTLWL